MMLSSRITNTVIIILAWATLLGSSEAGLSGNETSADKGAEASATSAQRIVEFDYADETRYTLGNSEAKLVMVEFVDYQCGHCSLYHEITYQKVKSEYIDTGRLFYVVGNYPLEHHRFARKAAEAAYCAGDQGRYWEMRDFLFHNSRYLNTEKILELGKELGLDTFQFNACVEAGLHTERVENEKREAHRMGIKQTPTFILAKVNGDGTLTGGLITGTIRWTQISERIDALLE